MKLADMTWPEVDKLDRETVVIYPIASLEQHSRHLPFFTDSILVSAVADGVEARLAEDVLLLPVQWLGASAHHLGMAGTLTAEIDTHIKLITEPLRCQLRHGFRRILVLNGHGGNSDSFHLTLRQLITEFPDAQLGGATYWDLAEEEIAGQLEGPRKSVGHSCEVETSMIMALRPDLVRRREIHNDGVATPGQDALRGVYVPLDMKTQTRHGGEGYPELAAPQKGRVMLDAIIMRAVEAVRAMRAGIRMKPARRPRRNAKMKR
jgi:creatinine amidohydrolase